MANKKSFSIVIPSYSGAKTIGATFDSLLLQDQSLTDCEVVLVIDGPVPAITQIAEAYLSRFKEQGIKFLIHQSSANQGRFEARVTGAKLARHDQLLFLEDRVFLGKDYFKILAKTNEPQMLSNLIEIKTGNNPISLGLNSIRQLAYGKSWGRDFKDYYINAENFERSPKGMASLWVGKKEFLAACKKFAAGRQGSTKEVSDDTGVLRLLIENGQQIKKSSRLKIYYQPRQGFWESVVHLFSRGPKFVDYYGRPGTRFFGALTAFYVVLILAVLMIFWRPLWFLWALVAAAIFDLALSLKTARGADAVGVFAGLPLIALIFACGVIKGTFGALMKGTHESS